MRCPPTFSAFCRHHLAAALGITLFSVPFAAAALADDSDVTLPQRDIDLIKTTRRVEVSGTNDRGGSENFTIHNAQAISQFVQLLTSARYTAAPKALKPEFKSMSIYQINLIGGGDQPVLQFRIIADSILDLPNENFFYMESDQYSENLLAPLLRLR
jgi:hypothetical protein